MTFAKSVETGTKKFDAKARKLFLDQLAETANVRASSRGAGVSVSCVYRERRRSESFRSAWGDALTEGYSRLETELLSEALVASSGTISDKTLRSRAQKYRLGLTLLSAHRGVARGPTKPVSITKSNSNARQRMEAKFAIMHERMKAARHAPAHLVPAHHVPE